MSDPNGEDAMACLQIALVILALVAIAIATGGTGLVFAGALLGATAGAAAGGTIAANQYYNANGTLNGASEAVMGGVATGSMIGTVCGLSAGYGAELLMTAGTQTVAAAAVGEGIGSNLLNSADVSKQIANAERVGSALKNDICHRVASFVPESQLANGKTFSITGGDGVQRNLLQVIGEVNGKIGVFEYLLDPNGTVTHQLFKIGGVINGKIN